MSCSVFTGCSLTNYLNLARVSRVVDLEYDDRFIKTKPQMIKGESYRVDFTNKQVKKLFSDAKISSDKNKVGTARNSRNELQSLIITASNENCLIHQAGLFAYSGLWNSALDITSSSLAGASSVIVGATATHLASALATSTRAITSKEMYYSQFVPAIIKEINRNRSNQYEIIQSRKKQPIDVYTVNDAIVDAVKYNNECSFFIGVTSLISRAGSAGAPTKSWVEQRRFTLKDELAYNLDLLKKNGTKNNVKHVTEIKQQNVFIQKQLAILGYME